MKDSDPLLPKLPAPSTEELLLSKLDVASAQVWGNSITRVDIEKWLENFNGSSPIKDNERINALHLLSNFNLFGIREIRELLRALYRDLFRYPIVQQIRANNNNTFDRKVIESAWRTELACTRFLGMGNPSESGAHLLYYFRQANSLSKRLFIHQHEVFDGPVGHPSSKLSISNLKRLIFIDDVLGSGTQAREYSQKFVSQVKRAAAEAGEDVDVEYLVLFAKEEGLLEARTLDFDRVEAVHDIQASELAFSPDARIYSTPPRDISQADGLALAEHYGRELYPEHPLGYKDGQLLLGFPHNIPDNSLPIVWWSGGPSNWKPAFPRYGKIY